MSEVGVVTGFAQGTANRWSGAAYDGRPGTASAARRFADGFLARAQTAHGVPVTGALSDTVLLVVSELVTNAAKYAPGPCLLDLELTADDITVTVWDTNATLPSARPADPGRIGQHGLEIVLALCRRFDVERHAGGKSIRAHLPLS